MKKYRLKEMYDGGWMVEIKRCWFPVWLWHSSYATIEQAKRAVIRIKNKRVIKNV